MWGKWPQGSGIILNHVLPPGLPEGPGLAARYPGDVGIEQDDAVVLAEDFEDDRLTERGESNHSRFDLRRRAERSRPNEEQTLDPRHRLQVNPQ